MADVPNGSAACDGANQTSFLRQHALYADRLPIGTEHSLRTFSHSALKRFYADWYRPELMTVLIVGDMDADGMVSQIDHLFSDMSAGNPARPLPDMSWPRPDVLSFTSAYDSELPHPMISILSPLPAEDTHSHQSYLKLMTRSIISRVCSDDFYFSRSSQTHLSIRQAHPILGFIRSLWSTASMLLSLMIASKKAVRPWFRKSIDCGSMV